MEIIFFETGNGLDKRAVKGGIYHVELLKKGGGMNPISLYIGESAWIACRCGQHLYSFFENPQYFGLKPENAADESLILKFSVLDSIDEKKSVLGAGSYKQKELQYIQKEKPLTQLETSDRQIKSNEEKLRRVQEEMIKRGFISKQL